jgi:hypothetical protein
VSRPSSESELGGAYSLELQVCAQTGSSATGAAGGISAATGGARSTISRETGSDGRSRSWRESKRTSTAKNQRPNRRTTNDATSLQNQRVRQTATSSVACNTGLSFGTSIASAGQGTGRGKDTECPAANPEPQSHGSEADTDAQHDKPPPTSEAQPASTHTGRHGRTCGQPVRLQRWPKTFSHGRWRNWTPMKRRSPRSSVTIAAKPGLPTSFW